MFNLAPVSLWLEDYSSVKAYFDELRAAGIIDLKAYLGDNPQIVKDCTARIRLIKVNAYTLSLFEAASQSQLTENLDKVFRDDMLRTHVDELVQLWNGETEFFGNTTNYTLSGKRLDIELKGSILPGHEHDWSRVLVAIQNVTDREAVRRRLSTAEEYARGLFEHSPVSLWVEDFSAIKLLLDELRERGITDFRTFTDVHPDFVERCMSEIQVIDVNRQTLTLFAAHDKETVLRRTGEIFRDAMHQHFKEQLIDLWSGKLFQQREVVNYSLEGQELQVYLQFSVLPGHEHDWSRVQIALIDITARKKAEAYLEYLGKHDVLTRLYNRSFYVEELSRLERKHTWPLTVVFLDLDGLKVANDQFGHAAGDALLRRVGEVLNKVAEKPIYAARIGGDEFAVLIPGGDEKAGRAMMDSITQLIELNNQYYIGSPISLSMGMATSEPDERIEPLLKRADNQMYEAKRARYSSLARDRRRSRSG